VSSTDLARWRVGSPHGAQPANFQWLGFTDEQVKLLDQLDLLGNNGWARNSQSEVLLPIVMDQCANVGLSMDRIKDAMASIGYHRDDLHQLDRWESKRTTGKFGR
jgi:hypothetical protein